MIGKKCIFRTYSAGVHYGELELKQGKECLVKNSIRIWSWSGALSLSEISTNGPGRPKECKFSVPVDEILLTEVIEIIPCEPKAIEVIESIKPFDVDAGD